jgi:hypothetical protein
LNFYISQETGEKRKVSKRTLKAEKELLEFSLKYQQVLAERDSCMLQWIYLILNNVFWDIPSKLFVKFLIMIKEDKPRETKRKWKDERK